jgi:hypothetical protein
MVVPAAKFEILSHIEKLFRIMKHASERMEKLIATSTNMFRQPGKVNDPATQLYRKMAAIFMSPASFRVIEHSRQPASNE